ncbi:MAG: DUF1049 domain-containing protein [Alphaproteobacteria bacterium]|nr:DUF1049 domain-containing protein [Alphaproteobacteria bacterium]
MKKLLSRLFWLPLGFLLVMFLVANRQPVSLSLDPISVDNPAIATPALPLWLWLAAALLIGFFAGAFGMWLSGRPRRRKARAERRELKALKREIAASPGPASRSSDTLPTLQVQ